MKKYAAIGGALALAMFLTGCNDQQKCDSAKFVYDQFVKSGRGGAAEKAAAKKEFESVQKKCAAAGIII